MPQASLVVDVLLATQRQQFLLLERKEISVQKEKEMHAFAPQIHR